MLNPGDSIERYTVVRVIGMGGHATVYLLRHTTLGSEHALKVVNLHRPDLRARLLQEGRIQANLQHPNIVQVTDVLEVAGLQALLMPYVDGPDLGRWLERYHPVPIDTAVRVFRQVVEAVHFAHRRGFVHRDLKPANILMDKRGNRWSPRITDFGIAKITGEPGQGIGTRSGIGMGTPSYMAPEQVESAAHVDHRADIFALGCILYELLTGTRLYSAASPLQIAVHISSATPVDLGDIQRKVPQPLLEVLQGCLEKDRNRRFPDCQMLLEHLGPTSAITPVTPLPEPTARPDGTGTATPVQPLTPLADLRHPTAPPDDDHHTFDNLPVGQSLPPPPPPSRTPWILTGAVLSAVGGLGLVWSLQSAFSPAEPPVPRAAPVPTERPSSTPVPSGEQGLPNTPAPPPEVPAEPSGADTPPADPPPQPAAATPETPQTGPSGPVARSVPPSPEAPTQAVGTLNINSRPYSNIWVDGTAKGETWKNLSLPVGAHTVRLEDSEHRVHTMNIQVLEGAQVNICWDFDVGAACTP